MKLKKLLIITLCCVMAMGSFSGCKATKKGDKTCYIKIDAVKAEMDMEKITYYDFIENKKLNEYCGENCYITDRIMTETDIYFVDANGDDRWMKVDIPLSKKPKEVKICINRKETEYQTYKMEY